jgi:enterobactin synthetase component D
VPGSLATAPLLVDLGPAVVSAGFVVTDYQAVISELGSIIEAPTLSERAVPKRRAEFLAGRWAARQALRTLGVEGAPSAHEDGSPHWPPEVAGSISHGAGRALCAVARLADVRGLGIDVERLMGEATKVELMARICSDEERLTLAREVPAPEAQRVTFAFSAKESLYKCLYPLVRRFMDFSAARVVGAAAASDGLGLVGELTLELNVDWSAELRRGLRFRAPFVASDHHVESGVVLTS